MAEIYKVKYQILTPIHIGTGEDLTPFDYVIVDDNFHRVNADEIISSLSQEQLNKFYALIEQNNITSLRELIAGNFDEKRFSKYKVKVTKNVAEKYQWNLRNVNNQLLISPFVSPFRSISILYPSSINTSLNITLVGPRFSALASLSGELPNTLQTGQFTSKHL